MSPNPPAQHPRKVSFFTSLQTKYAFSYLVLFAIVLLLLNTYPILASQDLLFGSKRDAMKGQAAVISSALMDLETLSAEQVERVMTMLDSTGLSRVLVTDPAGMVLYDSAAPASDGVSQPDMGAEHLRGFNQHAVADVVPIRVVDFFEIVNV